MRAYLEQQIAPSSTQPAAAMVPGLQSTPFRSSLLRRGLLVSLLAGVLLLAARPATAQVVIRERVELEQARTPADSTSGASAQAIAGTNTYTLTAPASGQVQIRYVRAQRKVPYEEEPPTLDGYTLEVDYRIGGDSTSVVETIIDEIQPPAPVPAKAASTTYTTGPRFKGETCFEHCRVGGGGNVICAWLTRWEKGRVSRFDFGYSRYYEYRHHSFLKYDEATPLTLGAVEEGDEIEIALRYRMAGGEVHPMGYFWEVGSSRLEEGEVHGWEASYEGDYMTFLGGHTEYLKVYLVIKAPVQIVNADRKQTTHVNFGLWENAYTEGPDYKVRNSADTTDHFVDLDPERFFVRVFDEEANLDDSQKETVIARIGTEDAEGGAADDLTEIELEETGTDTGVFESKAQLLVAPDLPVNPDDDFEAHDGGTGPVNDDAFNDRTHWVEVGGGIEAKYLDLNGLEHSSQVFACHPDSVKVLTIQPYVLMEPFQDTGYMDPETGDHIGKNDGKFNFKNLNGNHDEEGNPIHDPGEPSEPYEDHSAFPRQFDKRGKTVFEPRYFPGQHPSSLNGDGFGGFATQQKITKEIERSKIAWAQACIVIQPLETKRIHHVNDGLELMADQGYIRGEENYPAFVEAVRDELAVDILPFFLTPRYKWSLYGQSMIPSFYTTGASGEDGSEIYPPFSFSFIDATKDPAYRTLAHEIGHALSNREDRENPRPIFFPQHYVFAQFGEGEDASPLPDTSWETDRRITRDARKECREYRDPSDWTSTGSPLLGSN